MFLTNPPTYISLAAFKAMPLDYDLSPYTDSQLTDILVRASGTADAIMRKSYRAQERTIRYEGDGTNRLELRVRPILYVKRAQIIIPGTTGPLIPVDQLLIDYDSGSVLEYTPMIWQGQGYFARFPRDVPVDFTIGYGYGLAVSQPTWTSVDGQGGGLMPGSYDVAVTAKTLFGETTASVSTVTTASGSILFTVKPVLGAYVYRAYIAPHGTTPLVLAAESPFTAYGSQAMQIYVNSLAPSTGIWPDTLPTADTSAPVLPDAILEAVRLLALEQLYEQNNLANRGVQRTTDGSEVIMWRSSEGNSGRGESFERQQARTLLQPYSLQAIF